jgi:hypothetical protein
VPDLAAGPQVVVERVALHVDQQGHLGPVLADLLDLPDLVGGSGRAGRAPVGQPGQPGQADRQAGHRDARDTATSE